MNKRNIIFGMVAFLAAAIFPWPIFAQLPTPTASCTGEWDPDGQYHPKGERYYAVSGGQTYECVACGGCTPVNSKSGGGTSAFPSGAGTSEQFAQQMMVNILGSLLQQALAPPPDNSAYLQQQAALKKAQKEAEQRERMAKWQQLEQARAGRQEQENNQLRAMMEVTPLDGKDAGSAFAVMSDWGSPADEFQARGTGRYDTSGLSLIQRLACANDFAQRARTASANGDYVNARYLNEQAENAMAGRNTELECRCDDIPDMPQTASATTADLAGYEQILNQVQQDVKQLQNIKLRLKEIEQEKQDAIQKIEKVQADIANIKNQPAGPEAKTATPAEDDDSLLLAAQQLLEQAQNDLAALEKDKQDLTGQQAEIENSLKAVQQQVQAAGAGQ